MRNNDVYYLLSKVLNKVDGWGCLEVSEWLDILKLDERFCQHCDLEIWRKLSSSDWVSLLGTSQTVQTSFAYYCNIAKGWSRFETRDWAKLLRNSPQYSKQYKESNHWKIHRLYEKLISYLVSESTQIQSKNQSEKRAYAKNKIKERVKNYNEWGEILDIWFLFGVMAKSDNRLWVELLVKFPSCSVQIAYRHVRMFGWEDFSGEEWTQLLLLLPTYAKFCDNCCGWKKLKSSNWSKLIAHQPKFARKCGKYAGWEHFTGTDWCNLLCSQPRFVKLCDINEGWSNFSSYESQSIYSWGLLISHHPYFMSRYDKYSAQNQILWIDIVESLRHCPEKCAEYDKYRVWGLINRIPFDSYYALGCFQTPWARLLLDMPQLASRFEEYSGWEYLTGDDWCELLIKHPEFSNYCDKCEGWKLLGYNRYPGHNNYNLGSIEYEYDRVLWIQLLIEKPEFADRCDRHSGWTDFRIDDWKKLLDKQPQFLNRCHKVDGHAYLSSSDLVMIVAAMPQLSEYFDENGLWNQIEGTDWVSLLTKYYFCDVTLKDRGRMMDLTSWGDSIKFRPEYAEAIKALERCMRSGIENLACKREQCDDKWTVKCNEVGAWSKFTGTDWQKAIADRPVLSKFCDECDGWQLLGENDWLLLIAECPHLVAKCKEFSSVVSLKTLPETEIVFRANELSAKLQKKSEGKDGVAEHAIEEDDDTIYWIDE